MCFSELHSTFHMLMSVSSEEIANFLRLFFSVMSCILLTHDDAFIYSEGT